MSYLALDRVPSEVTRSFLQRAFELIQVAVNNLNAQNFRKRLTLAAVEQFQRHIALLALATPHAVADTTPQTIAGVLLWEPAKNPHTACYFEATMASADASATAKLELYDGTNVLGTLTTTNTALTRVRAAVTMPASTVELFIRLYGTSASYNAYVVSARLILEK